MTNENESVTPDQASPVEASALDVTPTGTLFGVAMSIRTECDRIFATDDALIDRDTVESFAFDIVRELEGLLLAWGFDRDA